MTRIYKEVECLNCKKTKPVASKGLCRACYSRLKRNGSFDKVKVRNTCSVDKCDKNVVSNGLCDTHRKQVSRHGKLKTLRPDDWGKREKHDLYTYWIDTKRRETLNICDNWLNDFWSFVETVEPRPSKNHFIRAVDINNILGPDNWRWVEGVTKANRLIASRLKNINHERNRLRVSAEERSELLAKAGYKCEVCGSECSDGDCPTTGTVKSKSLCIDHCHETNKIRGVLCHSCNIALGHLKDSTELLRKAIQYLQKDSL